MRFREFLNTFNKNLNKRKISVIYNIINDMAEVLNVLQIHQKMEKGYVDIETWLRGCR